MFPGPNATVYYNEVGEPLGWSYESGYEPEQCAECGRLHSSWDCKYDPYDNDEEPFEEDVAEEDVWD